MSFVYLMEQGNKVQKKGGKYLVTKDNKVVLELPRETIDGLVVMDKVQITSEAMIDFIKQDIPVTWISSRRKFCGRLISTEHVNTARQVRQIEVRASAFCRKMQVQVVSAKIHNQIVLLRRYNRRVKRDNCKCKLNSCFNQEHLSIA